MKKILLRLSPLLICAGIFTTQKSLAQGTQFTYQGRLDSNGTPANGSYDLIFGIFSSSNGVGQVGNTVTNLNTGVSNGLFTAALDFGAGIFTGEPLWLGIGVRTNGGTNYAALSPLQPLTPAPYAIFAGAASNLLGTVSASQVSGSLPAAQLTGTDSNQVTFNNGGNTFDGTFYGNFFGASFIGGNFTGAFIGNGSGLAGVNAANSATLNGLSSSNFWQTTGNSDTIPGVNFVGTTDTNALELRVNARRALRIEPDPSGTLAPNLIGGYASNAVLQPGSVADTIAGGGYNGGFNMILTNTSGAFIGGGSGNQIGPNLFDSVIGAGKYNTIQGYWSVIGGGYGNFIQTNADNSAILGGDYNTIEFGSYASFLGGGYANYILSNSYYSVLVGGYNNQIQSGSPYSFIGGGDLNVIGTNVNHAEIFGCEGNAIQSSAGWSVIVNGESGTIQSGAFQSFIGGGTLNVIGTNAVAAFIGGGGYHFNGGDEAFIGGGAQNQIQSNTFSAFIGAGSQNSIQLNATAALIGGGYYNTIGTNSDHSIIVGGWQNNIQSTAYESVISGGELHTILPYATWSIIGGGYGNTNGSYAAGIFSGTYNYVGGGADNSFIGGGNQNLIESGSVGSLVGGGAANNVDFNSSYSVIGGGFSNNVWPNAFFSTISGGVSNRVGGSGGTVPGGNGNSAMGTNSFAAGTWAQATNDGSLVLTDMQYTNFYSTTSNQFSARFTGGVRFVTGGTGLTVDGQTVLGGTVNAGQYSFPSVVNFTNSADSFAGNGAGLTNVNAALLNGLTASNFWQTGGNSGTSPANGNFLGTLDNQPLEVRVNNGRAVRVEPTTNSANLIAGAPVNFVAPGTFGATVAGGGSVSYAGFSYTNSVAGNFGFVGGGAGNAIQSGATVAVIGGGAQNTIQTNAAGAVIGGGSQNTVVSNGQSATIAGGFQNVALANSVSATIGGGQGNTSGGQYSTVPGGNANAALGNTSFAAGNRAKANHNGSFVWADSQNADYPSTTNDQFSVRAQGGVRLNPGTNNVEIASGGIKVTGAGIGTSTAAFIHLSSAANTGGDSTTINNTLCNGDPNAMLFVTHTYNPPGVGANLYNKTVGVWYNGSNWAIYNEDTSAMATNISFNVLVIKR